MSERDKSPPHPPAGDSAAAERTAAKPRVLLIDDEEMICRAVRRVLGSTVLLTTRTDARAALAELEAGARYDAILCDLSMPGIGGVALYQVLQTKLPDVAATVIFLAGDQHRPDHQSFLAASGRPCIPKPFSSVMLLQAIRARLGGI
ncbi:MAG: response regulator [Deltaproteobacteria bacterium]|nr:response regulator [Deltaproteobacteria bacterium]